MASPKATYEFYMESRKKLDFDDAGKRESDWREWRDANEDRLKEPDHLKARQFQLRYLALTTQASDADDSERGKVVADLMSFLDEMTAAAPGIADHLGVLRGSVLNSTFARRMKLDLTVDPDIPWIMTPISVAKIYDTTVLPYYRDGRSSSKISGAWDRRISHEAKLATIPSMGGRGGGSIGVGDLAGIDSDDIGEMVKRFRRGRGSSREQEREERREDERQTKEGVEAFRDVRLPELKWGKARDALFFGTDRNGSLRAMTALVKENLNHEGAREWLDELTIFAKQTEYDPKSYYGGGG